MASTTPLYRVLIDFLSFTVTPAALARIKGLAKIGVVNLGSSGLFNRLYSDYSNSASIYALNGRPVPFRRIKGVSYSSNILRKSDSSVNRVSALSSQLADIFSDLGLTPTNEPYQKNWTECIQAAGLGDLDAHCGDYLDEFMYELVTTCSLPNNEWRLEKNDRGMYGYAYSARLLCNEAQAGVLAWGARNGGCFISLSGAGISAIDVVCLHRLMSASANVKITRCDVAYDSLDGRRSVGYGRRLARAGKFITRGRPPKWKYIEGGDLVKDEQSGVYREVNNGGACYYVGSRDSGKMMRVYEKGKQVSSPEYPDWVRWELELHSTQRDIPLEILVKPLEYIRGAYPDALAFMGRDTKKSSPICSIAIRTKQYFFEVESAISNASKYAGRVVNFMVQVLGYSADDVVQEMTKHLEIFELPKALCTPNFVPEDYVYERPIESTF